MRLRAGDPVPHLDGVAHREDVGDAGAHLVVDDDAAALADRQPGGPGEAELRPDADAHDHDVGRDRLAGLGEHLERRDRALAEAGHVLAQRQADAVAGHVELDVVGHLGVHRRHELGPRWTSVTSRPRRARFSAISSPMKPPPTTTARRAGTTVWYPV